MMSPRVAVLRQGDAAELGELTVADSFMTRLIGLIGRTELSRGEGMYFPSDTSIHMFFMRIMIDAVFVDGRPDSDEREIVSLRRLRPWISIVPYVRGARGVLELPSGTIERLDLSVGQRLRFIDRR